MFILIARAQPTIVHRSFSTSVVSRKYSITTEGTEGKEDFRIFFHKDGKKISPWHDIPLWADSAKSAVNFICEMPKGTNAKMEIATKEALNPIKQDVKKGAVRFIKYGNTIINYGASPQTWENPETRHPDIPDVGGDNDPIDVIELGSAVIPRGTVCAVKPVGMLALIDEGECDWKMLAISTADPLAAKINDLPDLEKHMPGLVEKVRVWYRDYKIPDGKPENKYAFGGEAKGKAYAFSVIQHCHHDWVNLRDSKAIQEKNKLK